MLVLAKQMGTGIQLIRALVILALLCWESSQARAQFQSRSLADLQNGQLIELKGDWDYFRGSWIEPGDERPAEEKLASDRVWKPVPAEDFKPGHGYATYRLLLTDVQPHIDGYSLAIRSASAAMKLMIYPKNKPHKLRIAGAGRVGQNADEEIPQLRMASLRFFPEADEREWVVLLHISNFHYGRGGLWTAPLLGTGDRAEARMTADRELLLFCLGMIMVIGIYNGVLFIRRPADKPTLMLALFCAVVCLRSISSDNLISWYIPALDPRIYGIKYLLEYGTMILGPLCCISFVHMSFPASSFPRLYRPLVNLVLLTLLIILTLDSYYCSLILLPIQIVTVVQIIFGLAVVVRAVMQRRAEALLAAVGCFVLSACVVYDILVTFNLFSQPYITSIGMSFFVFMQSQVVAQRFAKAFRLAEHLSLKLKEEVERQTLELRSIMENIPQGVFIMLADRSIQGNYSRELEEILGLKDLAGQPALPLLFKDSQLTAEDRSIMESILISSFDEPSYIWELNMSNLPHEFVRLGQDASPQILAIEWHPIMNREKRVDRVLVTLRNVTELRDLQASQRKDQEAFSVLLEIVQVSPERFRDFMRQSQEILRQAEQDAKAHEHRLLQRKLLMRLHTWKGLARSLHFKRLASRIHDAEQVLAHAQVGEETAWSSELNDLHDLLQAYENVGKERLGRMTEEGSSGLLTAEAQQLQEAWYRYHGKADAAQREALDLALEIYVRSLPGLSCEQLLDGLELELQSLALDLKKTVPRLEREGALEQQLPHSLYRNLSYALQHLVRNSMDHGIESPEERRARGKEERGRIRVRFAQEQGSLVMDYSDDGRGLDWERVLWKAEDLGLVSGKQPPTPHDLAQFIFAPGFSTRSEANMISGRGIGMDAVRLLVEESGGTISLVIDEDGMSPQGFRLRACWNLPAWMGQVA
jgi:PAS domain-containing protein